MFYNQTWLNLPVRQRHKIDKQCPAVKIFKKFSQVEELVQSPRIQRPSVYFCNFLMVEPGWRASLGRFRLNRWHYFKELLKNLASRHKCGDTLKKQFSVALSLLGELFFKNREFATECFVSRKLCHLLVPSRPKKEQKLLCMTELWRHLTDYTFALWNYIVIIDCKYAIRNVMPFTLGSSICNLKRAQFKNK